MFTKKNTNHLFVISYLLLDIFFCGCNSSLALNEKRITENVMNKGDKITAFNDYGELTIIAGNAGKRYLTISGNAPRTTGWLSDTVSVKLNARTKRYRGSLGLYCDTNIKEIRQKNAGGPTKVEMEEAQLHFETLEAVEDWLGLIKYDKGFNQHAWSSNGLYIRWGYYTPEYWFFPKPTILHILVFQVYVGGNKLAPQQSNDITKFWYGDDGLGHYPELLKKLEKEPVKIGGHKPENLPGAQNDKIKVEHLTDDQLKAFEKSVKSWW